MDIALETFLTWSGAIAGGAVLVSVVTVALGYLFGIGLVKSGALGRGPAGAQGPCGFPGRDGRDGADSGIVVKDTGFPEFDWIEKFGTGRRPDGTVGVTGHDGTPGADGKDGEVK